MEADYFLLGNFLSHLQDIVQVLNLRNGLKKNKEEYKGIG